MEYEFDVDKAIKDLIKCCPTYEVFMFNISTLSKIDALTERYFTNLKSVVEDLSNSEKRKDDILEEYIKEKLKEKENGVDILVKKYFSFKLKKKKVKNKSCRFFKNTKVSLYIFRNCIPTSTSVDIDDKDETDGYSWTFNVTFSYNGNKVE